MAEQPPSFAAVLKQASKDYDLRIGPLSMMADPVEALSTGNLAIDYTLGVGGLPVGRTIEMYGAPASGKSTLAIQTAATLQREIVASGREEFILYSDYEQAVDLDYARALGLDPDHPSFLIMQPDNLEQGVNAAMRLVQTGQIRLAIWDSVAAMTPSIFFDTEVGKAAVAPQARLMSVFLKKLTPLLPKYRTCAIFINHEMEVVDPGSRIQIKQYSTPGGRALKFYASVRMWLRQTKPISASITDPLTGVAGLRQTGAMVQVKVVKNKVGPPFQQCVVRSRVGHGFDNFLTALAVLVAHKKVPAGAGQYRFDGMPELVIPELPQTKTGLHQIHGEASVRAFAEEHPEWRDQVIKVAADLVAAQGLGVEQEEIAGELPSLMGDGGSPLDDVAEERKA